jgi:ribosomal protein L13E
MKRANGLNEAATLLAEGPIDLVGHGAEPRLTLGYSLIELERAGLTVEQARELGLPIEATRASGVGANVMRLRRLLSSL